MDKKDYLLDWGLNFVDNFKFEDEAKVKRRVGVRNYRTKKLPLNHYDKDLSHGRKHQIGRLNRVATIKAKDRELIKDSSPYDSDYKEKEFYDHTLFITKTILSSQQTREFRDSRSDSGNRSEDESTDLSSLSSLSSNSIDEEQELFDEISHQVTMKNNRLEALEQIETEASPFKSKMGAKIKYHKDLKENHTHNHRETRQKIAEKIFRQKQFPYLKDFFNDFYPDQKKLPNNLQDLELLREPAKYIDIIAKGGMGAPRLIEDPENTDYRSIGYIYLDDQHKITNQHFMKFKPSLYKKPNAVRIICVKTEQMLLEQKETEKKTSSIDRNGGQKRRKRGAIKEDSAALESLKEVEKNEDKNKDFPLPEEKDLFKLCV